MSQQNQSSRAFLFLVVALVVLLIVVVVGFGLYFLHKLDESSKQNEKIEKIDSQLQTLQEEQEENSDYEIKRNSQSKNDKKAQTVQTPVESKVNTSLLVVAYVKDEDGSISYVCESELMVSYNDFIIGPLLQLKTYEFQNPRWFTGRCVVSKTMNYIENSLYGFKELAGCKIFLKPHQLKTVMRCLQAPKCRYMLADEVGLGKTVEALSILKNLCKR